MDKLISLGRTTSVPKKLKLLGRVLDERDIRRRNDYDSLISLGGVEVLRTDDDHLEKDYLRVLDEIKNGTLQVIYSNGELIPKIELHGNRHKIIGEILKELVEMGEFDYRGSRKILLDPYNSYVAMTTKDHIELDIGDRYTNPQNTEYVVAVSSQINKSDDILHRMHLAIGRILGPHSFNAIDQLVSPEINSWRIEYSLPTRILPRDATSSLCGVANGLVGALRG